MKGKEYNKLVRDNIPKYLDNLGIPYEKRIASDEEYKEELIKKIQEELDEFKARRISEELADIIEVIESLKELPEFKDVEKVRLEKLKDKGGFKNKFIVKGIDDR